MARVLTGYLKSTLISAGIIDWQFIAFKGMTAVAKKIFIDFKFVINVCVHIACLFEWNFVQRKCKRRLFIGFTHNTVYPVCICGTILVVVRPDPKRNAMSRKIDRMQLIIS